MNPDTQQKMKTRFAPNHGHKSALDQLLLHHPGVRPGSMFGCPAYYIDRRLFACVYGDCVGIKLPAAIATSLVAERRASRFQPYGKARMREWVQLCRSSSVAYHDDAELLAVSMKFVKALASGGRS